MNSDQARGYESDGSGAARLSAAKTVAHPVDWRLDIYRALKAAKVQQVGYVPDAGHSQLIELFRADPDVRALVLSTEEEGVALAAGAWLGGQRGALLMQSSGVGNCINMLSLVASCRFPFLTLVTMRGEWGEFNPWQIPMSRGTQASLECMGVKTVRVDTPALCAEAVRAASIMVYEADQSVAILLEQRLLGAKRF